MTRDVPGSVSTEKIRSIANAVRNVELSTTEAWSNLDVLSADTHIEAVEVFEDEIRQTAGRFQGPINVHVTLQYPNNVTLSETFPGRFEGQWKEDRPSIDKVAVDTSSFYS
jgi:hypothetical protein